MQRAKKQVSLELKLCKCLFSQNCHYTLKNLRLKLNTNFKLHATEYLDFTSVQNSSSSHSSASLEAMHTAVGSLVHTHFSLFKPCLHQFTETTLAKVRNDTLTAKSTDHCVLPTLIPWSIRCYIRLQFCSSGFLFPWLLLIFPQWDCFFSPTCDIWCSSVCLFGPLLF